MSRHLPACIARPGPCASRPTQGFQGPPARRALFASVLAIALCGALGPLLAAPAAAGQAAAATLAADLEAAFARLQQAGPANEAAVHDAAERFARLAATHPDDPVLRAYAGATTAMRASTTWAPWKKIAHAEDGLALIDKALAQLEPAHDAPLHRGVPASLEVRYIAANTFLALPAFFNRSDRGRKLLDQVLASPLLGPAPAPFRATVWMRAGSLAEADHQGAAARQWYERVAASGAPQADAARQRLAGL